MSTWLRNNGVDLACRLVGACGGAAACALTTNQPPWIAAIAFTAAGAYAGQLVAAYISRPKN